MQILGLGRKCTSSIFCSFPAAAMSSVSFLTQCHSFSLVLQRHCSTVPAKQMMVLLYSKQEMGLEEHSSLSLWFFVCGFFVEPDIQQKWLCLPQKIHATVSLVLQSWDQPLFSPRARYHCSERLWFPTASCNPQRDWGPAESSTHTSTHYSSPSGELIKAAMAGDSDSDGLHEDTVLD